MLDAGVDLRDVQIAAGHADPGTTKRYDRARKNLDMRTPAGVARGAESGGHAEGGADEIGLRTDPFAAATVRPVVSLRCGAWVPPAVGRAGLVGNQGPLLELNSTASTGRM